MNVIWRGASVGNALAAFRADDMTTFFTSWKSASPDS